MVSTPIARETEVVVGLELPAVATEPLANGAVPQPRILAGFELSLATAPLEELDRAARSMDRAWLKQSFDRISETEEVLLLATCTRRELVVLCRSAEGVERWREELPGIRAHWRERGSREVVRHLFRVAAGRESMVVGEGEVRRQVRAAGHASLGRGPRASLRELAEAASATAERLLPCVPTSRSIAAVAASRVLEFSGRPFPRVLVIGAGAMGKRVVELLAPNARVTVAYRQRPPDEAFLRATGARAVRSAELAPEVALSDAVVSAVTVSAPCLGRDQVPTDRPILLIDLGMPRNIDPAVRTRCGVQLLDLADLRVPARDSSDPELERSLDAEAQRQCARLEAFGLEPWVSAVRRRAEATRRAEVARAQRFLGELSSTQRDALEKLTRRLVDQLLRGPTERLRRLPAGDEPDRLRRFALELWEPPPAGP